MQTTEPLLKNTSETTDTDTDIITDMGLSENAAIIIGAVILLILLIIAFSKK